MNVPPSAEARIHALLTEMPNQFRTRDQAERFVAATTPHELEPEHLMWREWK
jgi:hypothetical protein